jgi:hypothetical protein
MSRGLWLGGVAALIFAIGLSFHSRAGAESGANAPVVEQPATPVAATDAGLCGGKVCNPDQFCCGPPACGHCAYKMAGPVCPKTCP